MEFLSVGEILPRTGARSVFRDSSASEVDFLTIRRRLVIGGVLKRREFAFCAMHFAETRLNLMASLKNT